MAFTADNDGVAPVWLPSALDGICAGTGFAFSSEHGNIPAQWNSIEQGFWTVLNGIPFNQLLNAETL
ncbi:MAG: hypothetical protein ISS69_11490 [Phycisphaerae bacterium]|nr:hypothetical protein [Phycisphaerae bacterium]